MSESVCVGGGGEETGRSNPKRRNKEEGSDLNTHRQADLTHSHAKRKEEEEVKGGRGEEEQDAKSREKCVKRKVRVNKSKKKKMHAGAAFGLLLGVIAFSNAQYQPEYHPRNPFLDPQSRQELQPQGRPLSPGQQLEQLGWATAGIALVGSVVAVVSAVSGDSISRGLAELRTFATEATASSQVR